MSLYQGASDGHRWNSITTPESIPEAHRGVVLIIFQCISIATMVAGAALALVEFAAVIEKLTWLVTMSPSFNVLAFFKQLYAIVLSIAIAFTELEWTETLRTFILLQNWVTRGLAYIFVGLMAIEKHTNSVFKSTLFWLGIGLIAFGGIYAFMGLLCLKRIRDQKMARYIQLLSNYEVSYHCSTATDILHTAHIAYCIYCILPLWQG
jgi:hypothetical protein